MSDACPLLLNTKADAMHLQAAQDQIQRMAYDADVRLSPDQDLDDV